MLKLIQLNVEQHRHYDRFMPFLRSQNADVICLEEVPQHWMQKIELELRMKAYYVPLAYIPESDDLCGVMILSKHKLSKIESFTYLNHQNYLLEQYSHSVLKVVVTKDDSEYVIMCTHFPVTPNGDATSDEQKKGWDNLKAYLDQYPHFALAGDFNAGRGYEMHKILSNYMTDNLPPEVKNTLDPKHHKKPFLVYAVDNVYTKGNHKVSDMQIIDDVSDHVALVCNIKK